MYIVSSDETRAIPPPTDSPSVCVSSLLATTASPLFSTGIVSPNLGSPLDNDKSPRARNIVTCPPPLVVRSVCREQYKITNDLSHFTLSSGTPRKSAASALPVL